RNIQLLPRQAISQAAYDMSETTYRVAQQDYEASVQLFEMSSIAREEDLEAQEAVVRGLEAQVVTAELRLEDSTLLAPYDGVIARRLVEENQNVQAKAPIVRFQDVDEVEIVV